MSGAAGDAVAEAADALYRLVPEEFTAARNARVADVKASDAELAKRIAALRRPSPAAWIVNRLARDRADELGDLVGIGGELALAQASGDGRALTALVGERRRAIGDLLRHAATLADAADRAPSRAVLDEVERTLVAATVSAEAGSAVRSGRLVRAVQAVGSEVDLAGAVAGGVPTLRPAAARRSHDRPDDGGDLEARRNADAELAAAQERAEAARLALRDAEAEAASAGDRVAALKRERKSLESRLDAVREQLAEAEHAERAAARDRDAAAHAADRAGADLEGALAAVDRLD
ncbi:hypothetical protein [Agromyces arachidis]|uniref:hypothetical protein n=1 Tax=Agromyces arachidis TaxID=766966 RepID=UPI004055BA27